MGDACHALHPSVARILVACLIACLAGGWAGRAHAVPITVRGSADVEVVATREGDAMVVRGELTDDVGATLGRQEVRISLHDVDTDRAVEISQPFACETDPPPEPARRARDRRSLTVTTDDRGVFCVRLDLEAPHTYARARFAGDELYEAAEVKSDVASAASNRARTILRLEPAVERVDLDRETFAVTATLAIDRQDARRLGVPRREGQVISLFDERDELLARAKTAGDGRARFEVPTKALAPPGPGQLRVVFDEVSGIEAAQADHPLIRHATVQLSLAEDLSPGDPEDGIPVEVDVTTLRGPVDGGVVEALRGALPVGAADVVEGHATVTVSFPAERSSTVPLSLRYVSSKPWYRSGPPLAVDVAVAGPSIWQEVLTGLLVAAIAAWIVAQWRRAPKPEVEKDPTQAPPPSGRPGVSVVATGSGRSGWTGVVRDAHDGYVIAGARLSVIVPTFEGDGVVHSTVAGEDGAFELAGTGRPDARLLVEAPMHASHEQALPPPSLVSVALVTRRRALVDRLVRWARRMGAPYDGPPEPTPGHVRRVATRARVPDVADWARSVEHTVFGSDPVDADAEHRVRSTEPVGKPGDR